MASRVGVEKIPYTDEKGHVLNQRADKPAPKVCQICGSTKFTTRGEDAPISTRKKTRAKKS